MSAPDLGSLDLDATFRAFEAATNEKAITAEVLGCLIKAAFDSDLCLQGDRPIEFYEPGIGEGVQAANTARALHHITGRKVDISADEPSSDFLEAAAQRLITLPFVERFNLQVRDAFAERALPLGIVHVAVLSHMLCYAPEGAAVGRVLGPIVEALADDGLVFLVNNQSDSNFPKLMARYGGLALPDPVPDVVRAAEQLDLTLLSFGYRAAVNFGDVRLLERLRAFDQSSEADVVRTARLVEALCQRSLADLKRDGRLNEALEDVKAALDEKARFEIRGLVQVIPSRVLARSAAALTKLSASLDQAAALIPDIERRHPVPTLD